MASCRVPAHFPPDFVTVDEALAELLAGDLAAVLPPDLIELLRISLTHPGAVDWTASVMPDPDVSWVATFGDLTVEVRYVEPAVAVE